MNELVFSPTDFVAVLNQTLEYAYPSVTIVGELANFKVSRGRWVYFDLKDEQSSVKFFGTVYSLPGPLEEGMIVRVVGKPRMSEKYGFSVTVSSIMPEGEGSLKKAADLLAMKLEKEGLFAPERKRALPYPPETIALVTSKESAAHADFTKIIDVRWSGLTIYRHDVQVQGEQAISDIVKAIDDINKTNLGIEVIVVIRGGGSADDMAAFSTEQVTRAVAASRIPTLVAIGHESDTCLAELAADARASTPSNAAELLVPDIQAARASLIQQSSYLGTLISSAFERFENKIKDQKTQLKNISEASIKAASELAHSKAMLLKALDPKAVLKRGFTIIKSLDGQLLKSVKQLKRNQEVYLNFADGTAKAKVNEVE